MAKKSKLGKLRDAAKKADKEQKEEKLEEGSSPSALAQLGAASPDDPDRKLDKYELDSKLNLLMDAHDLMHNEKHMKQVKEHAANKKSKIESIADLRRAGKELGPDMTKMPKIV